MFNFNEVIDRRGTDSIKWNFQNGYGVKDGLLPFWIADTDFATVPEIMQAFKDRCEHPIMGYADPDDSITQAVQGWFSRRHGWEMNLDEMFLSVGVVTGIWAALETFLNPGDGVVILTPVYDAFFKALKAARVTEVDCPLLHSGNRYTIDYEGLEKAFQNGARALLFCNPHNPIGRVWTRDELTQLAELCQKYGALVISDEVHCDLGLFGHKYTGMATLEKQPDKLLIYTSVAKTFNMAGLVCSCVIVPNKEVRTPLRDFLDGRFLFGPASLAFPAIKAAYTYGDAWVDEEVRYIESNASYVKEVFAKEMPDVGVTDIEGTFLMWLDFTSLGMTSNQLSNLLVEKYQLALGKGIAYGAEGEGFMRLNIGCPMSTLEKGVSQLVKMYHDWRRENG